MRDMLNNVHLVRVIAPAAATADNTAWVGQVVDHRGSASALYAIALGGLADADATFAVLLEESDLSGSGFTAVDDIDLVGTELLAGFQFDDDNEPRKLGYIGNKRYTRLTVTPTGNTGTAFLSALAILGRPDLRPTANPPA